jgi:hypothetical protein
MPRRRRQSIQQRGRASLLWLIAGFLALQGSLALAIERRWLPELRDPEYGYRASRLAARTATSDRPFTVVMLGSSRTTRGFQASLLEEKLTQSLGRPVVAFNFGITGAGPLHQLVDLRRLLADGIQPDLLLIEVLPPLLAGQLPEPEANRLPADRVWHRELALLERYGASSTALRTAWWETVPVPFYAHRFAILSRVLPQYVPNEGRLDWLYRIDDSGWFDTPGRKQTAEQYRAAVNRAKQEYAERFADFRLGEQPCQALHELLDLCRKKQVPALLVVMPEGSEFRSWYPLQAWPAVESFLEELGRQYAVPLVSARDWLDDRYFSDSHHPVPNGARLFTERLHREILQPLLSNQGLVQRAAAVQGTR